MLHRKTATPTVALLAAAGLAAALSVPGSASAATGRTQVTPDCSPCYVHTTGGHAPLFRSNGTLWGTLPLNDLVEVTCYYLGDPPSPWIGDGYEDHVVWVNTVGNFTGHIPDYYVNFGTIPPNAGVPHC